MREKFNCGLFSHLDRSAPFVMFWWYHQKMRFSHENIRFSYFLMRFFKWFLMKSWEILMFSWENLIFWWYHQNVTKGADRSICTIQWCYPKYCPSSCHKNKILKKFYFDNNRYRQIRWKWLSTWFTFLSNNSSWASVHSLPSFYNVFF